MKKNIILWSNLLFLCTALSAQQPCNEELNVANAALTQKRAQEQEWDRERKSLLDSIKILVKMQGTYQTLSSDYKALEKKYEGVGKTDREMYERMVQNLENMSSLLKKSEQYGVVLQAQKEQLEKQLKEHQEEFEKQLKERQEIIELLKKDTTICHLRSRQAEEDKVVLKITQQKQLDAFKKTYKTMEDSIAAFQEELRDRMVFKNFESKTGRKFPEGIYIGNKNRRYSDSEQEDAFFPFDASMVRVWFNLEKEKNKLLLNEAEKYRIKRVCNLLHRYVPSCKLRLRVYYPPIVTNNANINPKKSAEFAASELVAFLTTHFDFLVNEAKMDLKYLESPPVKAGNNPTEVSKSWIDLSILD